MAFSLCIQYVKGGYYERLYIHKSFSLKDDKAPKVTDNQNYAMLFSTEKTADKFRWKNNIPIDYKPVFIAMTGPVKRVIEQKKKYYNKLPNNLPSIDDSMPDFLKGL